MLTPQRAVTGILIEGLKYFTIFVIGLFASAWLLGFFGILYSRGFTPDALTGGLAVPQFVYSPGSPIPRLLPTGNPVIDNVFVGPINAILDASQYLYNLLTGGNGSG